MNVAGIMRGLEMRLFIPYSPRDDDGYLTRQRAIAAARMALCLWTVNLGDCDFFEQVDRGLLEERHRVPLSQVCGFSDMPDEIEAIR